MSEQKPLNLYIVRHGETEGNVQRSRYKEVADHAIRLTTNGVAQAEAAGTFLAQKLAADKRADPESFGSIRVWHSPYYRARETASELLYQMGRHFDHAKGEVTYREETFLMEQKAGLFDGMSDEEFEVAYPEPAKSLALYKKHLGRAYTKAPLGETRIEVVQRVKQHFRTVVEDYVGRNIRHAVIVCHGLTARAYLMGWMRYAPEWLDSEKNPGNCWIRHVEGKKLTGYRDNGYIYGEKAPLGDPMATQRETDGCRQVFMLTPQRSNAIVPPGIQTTNPFNERGPK